MNNVRDFGAVGDGKTSDTAAIQRAIDAGGEVIFPPGVYKSGTLYLRSHTGLRFEPGAILLSGGDEEQWNAPDFCPQNRTSEKEKASTIWQSILELSQRLGITSLTEGVETREQLEMLRRMGCTFFQGYYFAKPMPVEEFVHKYLNLK